MEQINFILPEIFLSLSIMFLLIFGVFKEKSSALIYSLSIIVLLITAGLTFNLTSVANGSMRIGSGEMIYVENRAPVARAADQTEDIKLIIEF